MNKVVKQGNGCRRYIPDKRYSNSHIFLCNNRIRRRSRKPQMSQTMLIDLKRYELYGYELQAMVIYTFFRNVSTDAKGDSR